MAGQISYAVADGVARLTLDQPDKLNAVSFEMWEALPGLVARAVADDAVRVIAVTGAGEKAFCAGADISQFGDKRGAGDAAAAYEVAVTAANTALATAAKPTVALVRGICFGGGLGLAMCCDLRIARADARFRVPAARLGLGYAFENVRFLEHRIGRDAVAELLFTARIVPADDAVRLGLVSRVLPADTFEAEVADLLRDIAANAPLTMMAVKKALIELEKAPGERDVAGAEAMALRCYASADYAEGQAAFREKRTPRFRGS